MNIKSIAIADFIQDYKLIGKDGLIVFKALLTFVAFKRPVQIICDVQILSIKDLDLIYLLGKDVESKGIPGLFSGHHNIVYRGERKLTVSGYLKNREEFELSIEPL